VSLLVIFLVLCLSIFSVLSLSTAKSDLKLTEKSAQAIAGYYAADLACAEKAEQVLLLLQRGADNGEITGLALSLNGSVRSSGGALYIEFSHEIIPGQELQTTLAVERGKMSVLSWKAVDVGPWEPDYSINVWEGD
jgi:hypothetical protein